MTLWIDSSGVSAAAWDAANTREMTVKIATILKDLFVKGRGVSDSVLKKRSAE